MWWNILHWMNYMLHFRICSRISYCLTEVTILSVVLKKEFASMYLFELLFLDFAEPLSLHGLDRNSVDVEEPPTQSLLSESTSPLRWGGCLELWWVLGLEGCLRRRLLSYIFVNLKTIDKRYRSKRSTNPIEIINYKKLNKKQIYILGAIL